MDTKILWPIATAARLYHQDRAFEWLNTAYQERDSTLISIRTDFTMDSLRSDSRYTEVLRKVGFPHQGQWRRRGKPMRVMP